MKPEGTIPELVSRDGTVYVDFMREAESFDMAVTSAMRVMRVDFARDAETMDVALRSAVQQLTVAGVAVDRIVFDSDALARFAGVA